MHACVLQVSSNRWSHPLPFLNRIYSLVLCVSLSLSLSHLLSYASLSVSVSLSQMSAKECKKVRDVAENCGFTLEKEGQLDLAARKNIFQIEVCGSGEALDLHGAL